MQRTAETQKQRLEMERLMAEKLAECPEDEELLGEIVQRYRDLYSDYGEFRQKEVHYHLHELEKLIVPTQTTKSTYSYSLRLLTCVIHYSVSLHYSAGPQLLPIKK